MKRVLIFIVGFGLFFGCSAEAASPLNPSPQLEQLKGSPRWLSQNELQNWFRYRLVDVGRLDSLEWGSGGPGASGTGGDSGSSSGGASGCGR